MKDRVALKDVAGQAGERCRLVSNISRGKAAGLADTKARIDAVVRDQSYRPNLRAGSPRVQRSFLLGHRWKRELPNLYTRLSQEPHPRLADLRQQIWKAEKRRVELLFPSMEGHAGAGPQTPLPPKPIRRHSAGGVFNQ